jgi:hypothetical protein
VESLQDKIVNLAFEKFKEKYTARLTVYVNFLKGPLDAKNGGITRYVNELHDLVEQIYIVNKDYSFRVTTRGRKRPVNKFIDSITVFNEYNAENWQPFGAFKVNQIDPEWIQANIDQKERNLSKYAAAYQENWLLLVSNFGHKSSTHDYYFLQQRGIQTAFDQVYIYRYMDNTISKLK